MINCLSTQDIEAFHDGNLDPHLQQKFHSHIAGCDVCRTELEALQRADAQIMAAYQSIEPRPGWIAEVEAILTSDSIQNDLNSSKHRHRLRRFVGLATAALLLIATGLALWLVTPAEKQPSLLADKVTHESTSTKASRVAARDLVADDRELVSKSPAVLAQGDFLVGRHPDSGDDIELYWVLPIQHKQ